MEERVLEKLKRAEIAINKVEKNVPNTLEDFKQLGIVKDGIYKNLEDAIQSILDTCALIVKEKNLGIPSDEAGFTDLLYENGVINEEIKSLIDSFRGLRNRLVHRYGSINDEIVFENISNNLGDFHKVIGALGEVMKSRE